MTPKASPIKSIISDNPNRALTMFFRDMGIVKYKLSSLPFSSTAKGLTENDSIKYAINGIISGSKKNPIKQMKIGMTINLL
jgi:hypothetical protein